jgi:hypothetical protein
LEDVLMAFARLLAACFLVPFTTPLFAGDPHPSQLNVSFLAQPAPVVQDGSTRLVYEMLITNFSNNKYVLDAVEAKAGTANSHFPARRSPASSFRSAHAENRLTPLIERSMAAAV